MLIFFNKLRTLFRRDCNFNAKSLKNICCPAFFDDAARFPCFATGTPPAAITREEVVEILKEFGSVTTGSHNFQHIQIMQ